MTTLPGIAGQIEEAIGLDLTVRLLRRRGGTEFTIPVRASGSLLAEIIGIEAAVTLIDHLGPGKIMLPCSQMRGASARRGTAKRMLREGASIAQVALACDLHSRTVSNYRAEIEKEAGERQLRLPFDKA